MYVIGLDVGTSGVKSTVFDDRAQALYYAYREYNLICGGDGLYELDPRLLFLKTAEVLAESAGKCGGKEIRAICVTSFGESFVCFDKDNEVIGNTMVYIDRRGTEECGEFLELLPEKKIFSVCGQFVDKMFAVYKLRWLGKHRPEVPENTVRLSFITDYIVYMLGAEHMCDYSMAARSAMFDVKNKCWWDDAVKFAGIEKSILPRPVPSGSVTGNMSVKMAERLGMTTGVKLIVGGHDQIFAAIGSGARDEGDIANGIGTVDCMTSVMSDGMDMEKLLEYNLPVVPYPGEDRYVTYAFNMSGGCSIKWFRDTFAREIAHLPDAYDILNREIPPEPTDLYMLPYFAGGGTPYMDAVTPALLAGMRLSTTRGELFRAFMEGEAYEMRLNLDCLADAGINVNRVITVGGGAKSSIWMQMRADIFNKRVYVPRHREAGTIASAILCYANTGVYKDIAEAQDALITYEQEFLPAKDFSAVYGRHYQTYKRLYKTFREVYGN
jgi:xylulokinase